MEMQKYEYLENEKSFLNEIKTFFHSCWRAIISWKNKHLIKRASASFNYIMGIHMLGLGGA